MKKGENFYRRDPGAALAGMASMTLEQRGVYNTVIDLLYLTWRPLEDNRAYIASHCGCAVQKLNPIIKRLIEAGKLVSFSEDGQTYLSNRKFEDERAAIKGASKTRSGRREGEEKSGEVGEKSVEVVDTAPVVEVENDNYHRLNALDRLEKTRQDKKETTTIDAPVGDWKSMVDQCLAAAGDMADQTSPMMHSAADIRPLLEPRKGEPCTWAEILEAVSITARRQAPKRKPIRSWTWIHTDAWALRDKRLNAIAPDVSAVVPFRAPGSTSITDRIADDREEATRRAFERMDIEHG